MLHRKCYKCEEAISGIVCIVGCIRTRTEVQIMDNFGLFNLINLFKNFISMGSLIFKIFSGPFQLFIAMNCD